MLERIESLTISPQSLWLRALASLRETVVADGCRFQVGQGKLKGLWVAPLLSGVLPAFWLCQTLR
jgi:hypothetical protein|tara:strand:- start:1294 stop:1488 length:195 start_codon:yes stop_codon:yes gene_type:complete